MEEAPKPKTADDLRNVQMSVLIANALDSEGAHTSFGRLPLGDEQSAPIFGFGTSTRDQAQKQFLSEELSMGVGKVSPGPRYVVRENLNFKRPATVSFGKDERVTLGRKRIYDHYEMRDTATDPIKSKHYVQRSYGTTKFGTGSRAPPTVNTVSPGPQYFPPHRPEIPSAPQYTLGARRTNPAGSALMNQVSTTALGGPGRYAPENAAFTSIHQNIKHWSFTKRERKTVDIRTTKTTNQTYDVNSVACGTQYRSGRKTAPTVGFGTATRDQVRRLGMFKEMMATQPVAVRIQHPANY